MMKRCAEVELSWRDETGHGDSKLDELYLTVEDET
jgi:hypothetical protein